MSRFDSGSNNVPPWHTRTPTFCCRTEALEPRGLEVKIGNRNFRSTRRHLHPHWSSPILRGFNDIEWLTYPVNSNWVAIARPVDTRFSGKSRHITYAHYTPPLILASMLNARFVSGLKIQRLGFNSQCFCTFSHIAPAANPVHLSAGEGNPSEMRWGIAPVVRIQLFYFVMSLR